MNITNGALILNLDAMKDPWLFMWGVIEKYSGITFTEFKELYSKTNETTIFENWSMIHIINITIEVMVSLSKTDFLWYTKNPYDSVVRSSAGIKFSEILYKPLIFPTMNSNKQ